MFTDLFQYAQMTVTGLETINLVYCKTFYGFRQCFELCFCLLCFVLKTQDLNTMALFIQFFIFINVFLTLELLTSLFPLIPTEST